MVELLAALVGVMGLVLMGVIGWAFNMSNRVAVLEADKTSLKELLDAKLENITERLARIEHKLDTDPVPHK